MPSPARSRRHAVLTWPLVVLLLLTACGGDGGTGGAPVAEGPDGEWLLTEGQAPDGPVPLTDGAGDPIAITLTIDGSEWSGNVCNQYGGQAMIDGTSVEIGQLFSTDMGCPDDQLMEAERRYHAALGLIDRFEVVGDRLTLSGDDAQLTYARAAPAADAPLTGTRWTLDTVVEGDTASSVLGAPTLRFGDDGRFEAEDGCGNTIGGTYEQDEDELRLSDTMSTLIGCADDADAAQGQRIGTVLQEGTVTSAIDGELLTLTRDDRGLVYRAADG